MSNEKALKCSRTTMMTTLLILSIVIVILPVISVEAFTTTIYVDPANSKQLANKPFILNVTISNVVDLYGFEFKLGYNTTLLDIMKVDIKPFLKEPTFLVKNETNEGEGWYWLGVSSLASPPGINGSGTLVSITFVGSQEGTSVIDLYDTRLVDSTAQPMSHDVLDGSVTVTSVVILVDPSHHNATSGEVITINVTICNVTGLYGYDFKLGYNTTLLDCLGVELPPGHFLKPADPTKIYVAKEEVNDTFGFVWVVAVLLNPEAPKSGSGTLTTITFNTTCAESGNASCPLDLYDTALGDFNIQPIEHFVLDGNVFIEASRPWDLNHDRIVDIVDVVIVALAFGSAAEDDPGTPWDETEDWNPDADLNGDGIVDIVDLVTVALHFGEEY
jgi:hypothetical protein